LTAGRTTGSAEVCKACFPTWKFPFKKKIKAESTPQNFFLIFPVFFLCEKRFLSKNMPAMQQDLATLIYDLNTIKGIVESYLKKIAHPFKTER